MIVNPCNVREVSVSSTEPVTTAYAKTHLRVDFTDDDALIGNLITAAREWCEKYCGRSFVSHTYRADLMDFYDAMVLPFGPVQSITSVKYYNTDSPEVLTTLSSSIYRLNYDTVYRRNGASWPISALREEAVQITYVTGYKDTSSPEGVGSPVPEAVKSAILLIVGDMYENREGQIVGVNRMDNPTVKMLLQAYRLYQ